MTNNGSQDVSGYAIDKGNGELTPLSGSPFTTGANPLGITIPHVPSREFEFGRVKAYGRAKAKLTLRVPGPGRIGVTGSGVRTRHRNFRTLKPQIVISAKGRKRQQLLRQGHVTVAVEATFSPVGGSSRTQRAHVRLVKR